MLTRNNREYVPGYYQKLLNDNFFDKSNIQNKMKKKTSINIDCLINSINYNILSRLRSSRKDAPTINLKFRIKNITVLLHNLNSDYLKEENLNSDNSMVKLM